MKTKIVSAIIYGLVLLVSCGNGQEFTLTTSASNIISSKASIARGGLDGNPYAIIVATPLNDADKKNPHPIGAWYYKNKWNIFNTDHVVMPVNMNYKIEYWPRPDAYRFLHILTPQNIGDDGSYLDHPLLNSHPNAYFKILQNYTPDDRPGFYLNANEAKAGYNSASGKWYIANVNGKRLYPGTAYSVAIFSDGTESTEVSPSTTTTTVSASPVRTTPVRPTEKVAAFPSPTDQPARISLPQKSTVPQPQIEVPVPEGDEENAPAAPPRSDGPRTPCTDQMAHETVGKWTSPGQDDLAMADRTFSTKQHQAVLAKAQKAIELFRQASPELRGIETSSYRGIRGDPHFPGGPVPFRAEIGYRSYFCVGSSTASVDKRGKIIIYGNYGTTIVQFNSLRDVLDTVLDSGGFSTVDGDEIYEYKKDLGDFKGFTMIEPFLRDEEHHEAVLITRGGGLPYKPITREQFLLARIKFEQGKGLTDNIGGLNSALARMSPAERQAPAVVRDIYASPGRSKLFATEAEGGRHLVTIEKEYFSRDLPRDAVQLITVHWYWSDAATPKAEAVKRLKENLDFAALKQMLGK